MHMHTYTNTVDCRLNRGRTRRRGDVLWAVLSERAGWREELVDGGLPVSLTSAALGACRVDKALNFIACGTGARAPLPVWLLLCTDCIWDGVWGVVSVASGLLLPVRGAEFSMAGK